MYSPMPRQPVSGNPMMMLQRLQQNPMQMLKELGLNIPSGLSDPNQIIQHLMNSGQIDQGRYNWARQMAQQMRR